MSTTQYIGQSRFIIKEAYTVLIGVTEVGVPEAWEPVPEEPEAVVVVDSEATEAIEKVPLVA